MNHGPAVQFRQGDNIAKARDKLVDGMEGHIMRNRWLLFLWCLLAGSTSSVQASAVVHYSHVPKKKSFQSVNQPLGRRRSNSGSYPKILWVARKETKVATKSAAEPEFLHEPQEVSFDDLGPIGKVVAATTELGVAIVWNYCQGYLTGLLAGTALGLPGFLFRPVEPGIRQAFMAEVKGRFVRMNSRSVRFGKNFGGISAIFKGSDVAVRRLRYGKNDEWNDIFGSAIAGAIFARQEGPIGMAKGALLWGGMVYVLNGGIRATTSPITRYQEEPVEF